MTVRERLWEPVPHDSVHVLHTWNADTAQCTGHTPCVHALLLIAAAQEMPPQLLASETTPPGRLRKPAPHDVLQAPQAAYGA